MGLRFLLVAALALALTAPCNDDGAGNDPPASPTAPATTIILDPGVDARPGSTEALIVQPVPNPPTGIIIQVATRIGLHPESGGWDRIVFEFDRGIPPARVTYVKDVIACGSGEPVRVQGQAFLAVQMTTARAHNDAGNSTLPSRQLAGQGGVIQEARLYCDFEAHLDWAIGLRDTKPYKITLLLDPPRLVIDIKQ
ncbi:MAG TPA: hypothetical protein VNN10_09105 [Dehalococcoidia bacterium]|nr:hypothetical protein [Dehalococcoidia bacterium]